MAKQPDDTPQPRQRLKPATAVGALAALSVAVSALIASLVPDFFTFDHGEWLALIGLTLTFGLSERMIFHVEARNEAVSYTPTDLALAIGVLFVSPVALVVARTIGAAAGLVAFRRVGPMKLIFNLATFALETVVAVALFRLAVGASPEVGVTVWISLLLSLFIALVVGGFLVAAAISSFEGGLAGRLQKAFTGSPVFHLPGAAVASSIAVPMLIEPWLGIIALSPLPVVWSVVRTHGALLHRYTDLTSVHEFSREVGNEADPTEIAGKAVNQMAENLRADSVSLRIWDASGMPVDVHHGRPVAPSVLPSDPTDHRWAAVLAERQSYRIAEAPIADNARIVEDVLDQGTEDALVAPLLDDRGPLGLIVLRDRQGMSATFDEDDANRLAAMAQQLAVAIRKGQFHAQIQHEATHDRLTGLPNRSYFEAWVDQALAPDTSQHAAVLLLDLDRFKEINDAFGHHAGDQLLVAVSNRIRESCGDADIAARFGGDEFAIFMPDATAAEAAEAAADLSRALEQPFELESATVAIASSAGIAVCPEHGHESVTLLRRADIAMYDAKRRHVRSCVFSDDLEENDSVRLALLADLRAALENHDLRVHYQPKVNVQTDQVVAAEALVRWTHPERGPISPEVFVSLAEQSGLIEELTRQVLAQALDAAAEWNRRGWDIAVAVNVSAQSLLDEQLQTLVAAQLARTGIAHEKLTLEITESTMMGDPARTDRILRGLNDLGVKLSVDDFGTGFSSLVNLRHLPVSELKIDRSFVSEMMMESNDEVIVKSTIDLGHNLGLSVVAEGVETDDVQERLAAMGCDIVQGYGISRPIPADEFAHWVEQWRAPESSQDEELVAPELPAGQIT